jgi:putative ABC transport system permease protein
MGATWIVARAAVRRRRTQTAMIGVIVALCTATMLVGLALLAAVSGPFDRSFAELRGAHATAEFDSAKVTEDQVAATAHAAGVVASAGPFPVAVAAAKLSAGPGGISGGSMRIAGRTDPAGGVDELKLTYGRWFTAPGEVVISSEVRIGGPEPGAAIGKKLTFPGVGEVTIVGIAYSVTQTADAWMQPDEVRKIGATSSQMLYRFAPAAAQTTEQMKQHLADVTARLPADAVHGTSSYLTNRERAGQRAKTISSFLTVFAALSLLVAVLVIGNVVSGAVIAGFRSIGVLKAVGFSPGQVTAAYLLMMTGPALFGCAVGAVLGNLAGTWLLGQFGDDYVLGVDTSPAPALTVAVAVAIPALVALTALIPALRAGRQSATAALSSQATNTGRGRGIQRRLSRSRLPRSVSLGLALPVVRPARTLLTLVAIILGSATVVFATGLLTSAQRWNDTLSHTNSIQVQVLNPPASEGGGRTTAGGTEPGGGPGGVGDEWGARQQPQGEHLTDSQVDAFLRSTPGAKYVSTQNQTETAVGGLTENVTLYAYTGDSANLGYEMLAGRWFAGSGEAVVGTEMLHLTGKSIGDTITLFIDGKSAQVRIVGEVFATHPEVYVDWSSVSFLDPDANPRTFLVGLKPGFTATQFINSVATGGKAGLIAMEQENDQVSMNELRIVIGTLTLALLLVAGLGVAHTVVLNTRERRRDLAIVKAVGMTPGQVVVMAITSMAALGLIGGVLGLPGGVAAQQWIIRFIGDTEGTRLPQIITDVYAAPALAVLFLSGVVIAVLGALIPARQAARVSTASALHTE